MLCGTCKASYKQVGKLLNHLKRFECTWGEVLKLKRLGKYSEADTLIKKITGTYVPMSEEAKEKLKEYYEEHKDEILAKAKLKRMTQQAYERNIANSTKKLNRKVL
jgi:hypothetical protein